MFVYPSMIEQIKMLTCIVQGEIRLLEFAPGSKSLFFTTSLLDAVQSYSLPEARLLEPGPTHNSPPTVMAISPISHLLLTASESPPTVYIQNRTLGTQPLLLHPFASPAPVCLARFHPDRPNIFLLAFKDGTLASYDATLVLQPRAKASAHARTEGGEISYFKNLHAVTTRRAADPDGKYDAAVLGGLDFGTRTVAPGAISIGITGARFVPGYRSRAITVGGDGKCKVVDFEKNQIVRMWHIRGPATSLCILAPKATKKPIVAIGRFDGRVVLFDTSGAQLHELAINGGDAARVIDVEWIKGPSPKGIEDAEQVKVVDETWIELYTVGGTLRSRMTASSRKDSSEYSEIHADIPTPSADPAGTVLHRRLDSLCDFELPPIETHNYMDLFSPVKLMQSPPARPAQSPRKRSTPRQRPRLSSSTFLSQALKSQASSSPGDVADAGEITPIAEKMESDFLQSIRHGSPSQYRQRTKSRLGTSPGRSFLSPSNSKILADIRTVGNVPGKGRSGTFALFAPYMPNQGLRKRKSIGNRGRRISSLRFSPKKATIEIVPNYGSSRMRPTGIASYRASFQTFRYTNDETITPSSPLPPGFAQSYQGPVNVDRYLPRKGSLAFTSSPPRSPKWRSALGETTSNEQGTPDDTGIRRRANEHSEAENCECCAAMRDEMQRLRQEVAELRSWIKGKGRAGSCY